MKTGLGTRSGEYYITSGCSLYEKYPELLVSLFAYSKSKLKCEGRVLRRDTERLKRIKRFRKQPSYRLRQFESALFKTMNQETLLFTCPVCREVLNGPVTVECGHTFCGKCLFSGETMRLSHCTVCSVVLRDQNRCVNVLVQDLIQNWKDKNKCYNNKDAVVPNAADILGMQPRYRLRSGYAGLHINIDTEDKMLNFMQESVSKSSRSDSGKSLVTRIKFNENTSGDRCEGENMEDCKQFEDTLSDVFKDIDDIKEETLRHNWSTITVSDLECILCSRCLLDPITTSCGHTFCRDCLIRVLDHRLSCPLCMTSLGISHYSRQCTEVLEQAIQFLVPTEYNNRLIMSIKDNLIMDHSFDIPVFICTNAFPGVACPLYVYEPRYRLLARRCLQSSSKRFAMAGDKFVEYGTVLELKDAVSLADGRFLLTTVGVRRYKVISRSEQDGYDTAKLEFISDNPIPAEKLSEIIALHDKVYNRASKWIESLKPEVLAEVERLIGKMPSIEKNWTNLADGPAWGWWLMPILPLSSQLQVGFLSTTSLEKRLRAIDKMLEHLKIKMKALERSTDTGPEDMDAMDACGEIEDTFEMI